MVNPVETTRVEEELEKIAQSYDELATELRDNEIPNKLITVGSTEEGLHVSRNHYQIRATYKQKMHRMKLSSRGKITINKSQILPQAMQQ
ncbi:hypothetical protein COU62_01710 [Candidatus Pacearchaeota archaeon CG10_big_fil_rev_8_21_14_0_10_35_219]|nr:hypothetical protein [Candidatus Pacearchaeota archaeon]OIO43148.1 MAG: hypothetical protein AUJ63_00985 [Candidatus Pacearchaeota archaeon CG1_02_35_32]PIO08078.1 MAG: hypothetical protein COU62_01710 [Candidatus Pacearchaeota archaeon CG10_big_fil_rev_8_21_14_0_10_35_219]PIY81591.1 MAG: hypothetical protein COY79_02545 [Candidatus Pacearchaeota archaeon CG_4_10_14_0_8_um_filter_35_169]PIZ78966.1 MAG: hypothetical protein COY00_04930 [Candidatus Pacearchaeota archaeon CG_4_10_14_0_2_um_filt